MRARPRENVPEEDLWYFIGKRNRKSFGNLFFNGHAISTFFILMSMAA
jgi:hypothetical protein